MTLLYIPELISTLKNKHLLLDTNIFRDASLKPTAFREYFNELKKANVTLVTTDLVKYEILKGSANKEKYNEKIIFIDEIIDAILPITSVSLTLAYELIQMYSIDGAAIHITDLLLGVNLMQYKNSIYLMTRDTSDFLQNIFQLSFIVNLPHNKGIFTYGIYQYVK